MKEGNRRIVMINILYSFVLMLVLCLSGFHLCKYASYIKGISIDLVWFGLVWFYGISTIVGYLMSNPVYTYILDTRGIR